jgi:hypothetical protein
LDIELSDRKSYLHLGWVIQQSTRKESLFGIEYSSPSGEEEWYLTKLKDVSIKAVLDAEPPLPLILTFFVNPSIRSLTVGEVEYWDHQDKPMLKDLEGKSSITALHMDKVETNAPFGLVRLCPRLETFKWTSTHYPNYDHPDDDDVRNPTKLYKHLEAIASQTLKTLSLSMDEHRNRGLWQTLDFPARSFFGSLSSFPVLENLQIRLTNLIEFQPSSTSPWEPATLFTNILPPSLKFLYILDFHSGALSHLLPHLSQFAESLSPSAKSNHTSPFPYLAKFYIRPPGHEGPNTDFGFRNITYNPDHKHIPAETLALEASLKPKVEDLRAKFLAACVEFRAVERYGLVKFPA